jgi:Cysteine-rich secretory protein family
MGNRIIVIRRDGQAFGHDVTSNNIANAFGYRGSKVAFNGEADRFVLTMGNRIIVIRRDGRVFGHDIAGNNIENALPMNFVASVTSPEENELLDLIDDARTHPEKYPPRGNVQGAAMSACANAFQDSATLRNIARDHNEFLASRPIAVVNTFPNMHIGPSGKLVWEAGEPMDASGYHSFRGENVATGFSTAADALRFWMQDDEGSAWGHRNLILNCAAHEAGVGHRQGGPGGHYWTLDVGTK